MVEHWGSSALVEHFYIIGTYSNNAIINMFREFLSKTIFTDILSKTAT